MCADVTAGSKLAVVDILLLGKLCISCSNIPHYGAPHSSRHAVMSHISIQSLKSWVTLRILHSTHTLPVLSHAPMADIKSMLSAAASVARFAARSPVNTRQRSPAHVAAGKHGSARTFPSLAPHLATVLLVGLMTQQTQAVTPVPAGLTELSSAGGSQLLQDTQPSDAFWNLTQEFVTQDSQDWCGLASATMVLNALPIPKPSVHAFDG